MSVQSLRKKIFDFAQLRRVLEYTRPYQKSFNRSIMLSVLLAIITPIRPLLIQYTVNKYVQGGLNANLGVQD